MSGRSTRRRQDLARAVHRPGDQPQVRAHVARRRARRGGDPWSPRTYIGALPGKIVQNLSKVGVRNPLFLLDEVDKMSMDFRGDPSSALLEVLDPEQNHTFNDHYLEVDYDLSDVMFVATANTLNIPRAAARPHGGDPPVGLHRDEKVNIAERYLIPKQLKNNGLEEGEMEVSRSRVRDIIRYYTREAGVRNVEREIAKICRKVVRRRSPTVGTAIRSRRAAREVSRRQAFPLRPPRRAGPDRPGHGSWRGPRWVATCSPSKRPSCRARASRPTPVSSVMSCRSRSRRR